ncbi:MAG TPA: hypothetical protein VIK83_05860 [Coriobacteriia bacterium]
MQESGLATPIEEGPNESPLAAPTGEAAAPATRSQLRAAKKAATRPPRRRTDPVVTWLIYGIFGVVILWLVGMLSALFFGVIMPPDIPRTATERDLSMLGDQVTSGKATTKVYAQYVDALIRAGQLSKAQSALDSALLTAKTDRSYMLAEQAHLYMANKDYANVVITADKAMAEAQKELKAYMDENVRNNRQAMAGATMPTSYTAAALDKAVALEQENKYSEAIGALDAYLTQQPIDADVLVMRAQAKIKVGDTTGAEADFRAALKYIPDYQPAVDGLKQIGAGK